MVSTRAAIERWKGHSGMSDPAGHSEMAAGLPAGIGQLNAIIQGVLVHSDWLASYGLDSSRLASVSRRTLPVAERLDDVLARDADPLNMPRPPERRTIGTCRDFALMLCSFLRSKGVPARLRCGFAAYFGQGWEDHWVCEYWDKNANQWRLSDPQIDEMFKKMFRVEFHAANVPRDMFITAGQAWQECRARRAVSQSFGHGDARGLWFVKVNVWRDHYVLNGRETSAWDDWRAAPMEKRLVADDDIALLDNLAENPEQLIIEIKPDWLT